MHGTLSRPPLLLAACAVVGVHAADVNIRVIVPGDLQPGVYGRVDFGSAPPPPVLYEQPVIIVKNTRPQPVAPLYLHVPPGPATNWSKHCRKYGASDLPVLFVRSAEYEPGYKPKKEKQEKKEKD